MKITFLGTGAATAYPLPFCHCFNCRKAWELGGRSLRARSSVMLNTDLVIDPGPDIMTAAFSHRISTWDLKYCLLTHPHSDHFDVSHLFTRHPEYAIEDMPLLDFYTSKGALPRVHAVSQIEAGDADLKNPDYCKATLNLRLHEVRAFRRYQVGDYSVVPFPATHDPSVEPLLYAVSEGSWALFYGADTAALPEETWRGFHESRLRFDVVILDHTYGPASTRLNQPDHLDSFQFVRHVERMRSEHLLADHSRIFATHISHEGNPIHPELVRYAAERGYEVAYDGLAIEIN